MKNKIHDIPCHCDECEKLLEDSMNDPEFIKQYESAIQEYNKREYGPLYIGTKLIRAAPFTLGEWKHQKHENVSTLSEEITSGYKVTYEGGYTSWSPKEVFESAYVQIKELVYESLVNQIVASAHNGRTDIIETHDFVAGIKQALKFLKQNV